MLFAGISWMCTWTSTFTLTSWSLCIEAARGKPSITRPIIVIKTILTKLLSSCSQNKVKRTKNRLIFNFSWTLFFGTRGLRLRTTLFWMTAGCVFKGAHSKWTFFFSLCLLLISSAFWCPYCTFWRSLFPDGCTSLLNGESLSLRKIAVDWFRFYMFQTGDIYMVNFCTHVLDSWEVRVSSLHLLKPHGLSRCNNKVSIGFR